MLVFVFGFTYESNVIAIVVLMKRFVGWTKGPTYEIDVLINLFWMLGSKMVIHWPIVCYIVIICVFMIQGS
jgi:hypothetical protein